MNFHNVEFLISAASVKDFPGKRLPEIAFAGKSNVGKSSVINRLLQRKNFARVGEKPGKTIHVNYFVIDQKCYLVDLPGYGYAKVSQAENATVKNTATVLEGSNYYTTNEVTTPIGDPDDQIPQTGDNVSIRMLFALMLVSGGGIMGTALLNKKRNKTETI